MMRTHSPYAGTAIASFAAGPTFLAALGLGSIASSAAPIPIDPKELIQLAMFVPVTIAVGAIFSAVPNVAGTALMLALGRRHESAQMPISWALAGAGIGAAVTWNWRETAPLVVFAFAATGAACALICRAWAHWSPR